jgi:hypothetical protein
MIHQVFADCITGYISPFIYKCCAENNLDNKFLQNCRSAFGHLIKIEDYDDNIYVFFFLPSNPTSILQPMEQGNTATSKAHYLHLIMRYLTSSSDREDKPTFKQFWKNCSIKTAIESILTAWNKIT